MVVVRFLLNGVLSAHATHTNDPSKATEYENVVRRFNVMQRSKPLQNAMGGNRNPWGETEIEWEKMETEWGKTEI